MHCTNLYAFLNLYLPITENCKIFDCLVESVLSYGSEVWGFHDGKDIENVHTKFCKQMLCAKRSTNSIALYDELGRIPLLYIRKIRMVKYWLNKLSIRNSLLYKFYEMLRNDLSSGLTYSKKNLAYQVKCILDELGLSYLWFNQNCTLSHLVLIKKQNF